MGVEVLPDGRVVVLFTPDTVAEGAKKILEFDARASTTSRAVGLALITTREAAVKAGFLKPAKKAEAAKSETPEPIAEATKREPEGSASTEPDVAPGATTEPVRSAPVKRRPGRPRKQSS